MAAPSAPRIRVYNTGEEVRVAWRAVDDATDYNIYLDEVPNPAGVEDSVADDEVEEDGSFVWFSEPQSGHVYVYVTALNALAEESDPSNEVHKFVAVTGGEVNGTDALVHARKGPH